MSLFVFLLLLLLPSVCLAQSLTATWQDQSGNPCPNDPATNCQEDRFILERCVGDVAACGAGPFIEVAQPPRDSQSWVDSNGLSFGTDYTYRIKAENSTGQSSYSNLASAQTATPVSPDTLLILTCQQTTPPPFLLSEDFESYAIGGNPTDWRDTAAGNSFVVNDTLMTVQAVGGNTKAAVITDGGVNIHSHYIGAGSAAWRDYTFTGRMWISTSGSGVGVTFLSHFPSGVGKYYRLRRYGSAPTFRISPLGTAVTGDIESGVNPASSTWYHFRIQVVDTGTQTEIKANVWPDGSTEPTGWQIDAVDANGTRLTSGTIGLWSWATGTNAWDGLRVE